MYILGISTLGRSSAVALLNDRGVLFAIEEEKLTRLQDSTEVPRLALDRCLFENHLKLSEIRAIGLADRVCRPHVLVENVMSGPPHKNISTNSFAVVPALPSLIITFATLPALTTPPVLIALWFCLLIRASDRRLALSPSAMATNSNRFFP